MTGRQPSPAASVEGREPCHCSQGPSSQGLGEEPVPRLLPLPEPEHKGIAHASSTGSLDTGGHQLEASKALTSCPAAVRRWRTPKVTDADAKSLGVLGAAGCSGSQEPMGTTRPQQAPQCLVPSMSAACLLPSSTRTPTRNTWVRSLWEEHRGQKAKTG